MTKIIPAIVVLGALATSPAFASSYSGTCTTAPKAEWMTEAAAQAKLIEEGYAVSSFKTTRAGNCYEAYVTDRSGKRMELFLDPTTAKIVHTA